MYKSTYEPDRVYRGWIREESFNTGTVFVDLSTAYATVNQ